MFRSFHVSCGCKHPKLSPVGPGSQLPNCGPPRRRMRFPPCFGRPTGFLRTSQTQRPSGLVPASPHSQYSRCALPVLRRQHKSGAGQLAVPTQPVSSSGLSCAAGHCRPAVRSVRRIRACRVTNVQNNDCPRILSNTTISQNAATQRLMSTPWRIYSRPGGSSRQPCSRNFVFIAGFYLSRRRSLCAKEPFTIPALLSRTRLRASLTGFGA